MTYYYLYLYCLLFNVVCFEINWIELKSLGFNFARMSSSVCLYKATWCVASKQSGREESEPGRS